jgi:hypothetical protein
MYIGKTHADGCYRDAILPRRDFTGTRCYRDPMLQRPDVTETRCYRDAMLQRPDVTETRCYRDPMLQRPDAPTSEIKETCSSVWIGLMWLAAGASGEILSGYRVT